MEPAFGDVQHAYMARKSRPKPPTSPHQVTKIRRWREYREKSLEEVAAKLGITHATLSRIERGLIPYSQKHLPILTREFETDEESLLRRDPYDAPPIWPIWEQADEKQREMIVDIAKSIVKPR